MTARRNLLVVGEASSLVLQVLLAIHTALDARCIVVCRRGAHVLRFSSLCSDYRELDLKGAEDGRFVDTVNRLARALPDLVLIPADCTGARLIDRVRPQLRAALVPLPDAAMLDRFDDKWSFFQFCEAHGVRVPATRAFASKQALPYAETERALGSPFVLKPANRYGAQGVLVISGEADFQRRVLEDRGYQHAPLVAQRYIRGYDVGLNLLARRGRVVALAIQRRIHQDREGDTSEIHFFPHEGLERMAHTLVRASAYDGVMNLDARIEHRTGNVFLLESNPRFWRSLLASAWCGLNFVSECLQPPRTGEPRRLTSGSASTHYHPLFCAALWRYALYDRGARGRMVRCMLRDPCLLAESARDFLKTHLGHNRLALASAAPSPRTLLLAAIG